MHTDPRILTGKKGASTLTQWYDNEITGVTSDDHQSFNSCIEINSVSRFRCRIHIVNVTA